MIIHIQRIKTILLFAIIPLIFLSCTTTLAVKGIPGKEEFTPSGSFNPEWENVAKGIERMTFSQTNPTFCITALRINLGVKEREIVITPGRNLLNDNESGENNFISGTIKEFMNKQHLLAAINATPFRPYRFFIGKPQTVVGFVMSNGTVYSKNSKYDAFFVSKDKRIRFLHPPFENKKNYKSAAGGFFIILSNGINIAKESPRAARSLIGTVNAGNIVFFAAIDGENTPLGSGATFFESAEWMKAIGATNAINMDGGGSSVLGLRTNLEEKIEVLNHPEGGIMTFFQRNVPVFIGIR